MIILPTEIKQISQNGNRASFEISPLYPGYGITIGNALRRVLLSSIEGVAITTLRIENVTHEFSTLPNVREDMLDIILNLKLVRFKAFAESPFTAKLETSGEREVTAADIQTGAELKIMNPAQHIATLTDKKAELHMELEIQRGIGYVPAEMHHSEKVPVGSIAVDSLYSPVVHVGYRVENIRVGQRTDFNNLLMDIQTDGTMSPETALKKASDLLVQYFGSIRGSEEELKELEQRDAQIITAPETETKKKTRARKSKKLNQ